MITLNGSGLGGGIVVGRAVVLESGLIDVPRYRIKPQARSSELKRLERAIATVRKELAAIADHLPPDAPAEARALIEVHAMILDDPSFARPVREAISEPHLQNAEWAFSAQAEHLAAQFQQFEDAYLRERGRDVVQVAERVLKALAGSGRREPAARPDEPLVYVAHDISPADMLQLRHAGGFAIDLGGTASHSAILARSMDVPTVVGLDEAARRVRDDDWVILDGSTGVLIIAPEPAVLEHYRGLQREQRIEEKRLERLIGVACRTGDGVAVELHANIEQPDEARHALELGADGIGLFRTEFLFMNRAELPSEDEQFEAYRSVVRAMQGRPVTIRTLDIGADKTLSSLQLGSSPAAAANPALGQRAIRLSLAYPEVLQVQLRAILRAAAGGPVRLLVPMLVHSHEIDAVLGQVIRARESLVDEGEDCGEAVSVGGMIEVPAAALTVGLFVRRLDFLSLGTNDLVQYTLAIDRADHSVAALYDPFHPAVIRLIGQTIRACVRARVPVAVCGEMAADPQATRMLLGMGLTQFSMHPSALLRVKREILRTRVEPLRRQVARLLRTDDPVRAQRALAALGEL